MNSIKFSRIIFLATITASLLPSISFGKSGSKDRPVGAGMAFPSVHQALEVNSSTLNETSKLSLQGLWGFDTEEPSVTLAGSEGKFGWGLGWKDRGTVNVYDAGFGIDLGGFLIGTNLYSVDFEGLNGDVTASFEFSNIRLVTAFRGIDDGVDRFDIGIGFAMNKALISIDMFKITPWDTSDRYDFDLSLAYDAGKIGVGVGYDFYYLDGINGGDIHADLSLKLSNNFAAEGHYRLTPNHRSSISNWSAGIRLIF